MEEKSTQVSHKLISYLRDQLMNSNIQYHSPLNQLHGGYHCSTYSFQLTGVDAELSSPLVLRLFPPCSTSALKESTVQNTFADAGHPVARVFFTCSETSILGGEFLIMEFLPGELLMMAAPPEISATILGKAHAHLHNLDPKFLAEKLNKEGIKKFELTDQFSWLNDKSVKFPWIQNAVNWLLENRPAESASKVACHVDFHGLNILYDGTQVSGILDWTAFLIGDAAFDMARTVMIYTHAAAHMPILPSGVNWHQIAERYLYSYESSRPFSINNEPWNNEHRRNMEYYLTLHCAIALIQGFEGVSFWRHPPIENSLLSTFEESTGIVIPIPCGENS